MTKSEGNFLRSDNLLTERDPTKIRWETLPDGDVGLRSPVGEIAEEQSIVALSDGSRFTPYRTETDYPVHAYSRDNGRTWTPPEFMTYGPGARKVKPTRAANFVWKAATAATSTGFTTTAGLPAGVVWDRKAKRATSAGFTTTAGLPTAISAIPRGSPLGTRWTHQPAR